MSRHRVPGHDVQPALTQLRINGPAQEQRVAVGDDADVGPIALHFLAGDVALDRVISHGGRTEKRIGRDNGGGAFLLAIFFRTRVPFGRSIRVKRAARLTQPGGTPPFILAKSTFSGSGGMTRTRTRAVAIPALAST